MQCLIDQCDKDASARGLCQQHYSIARLRVNSRLTTWKELETLGMALPVTSKRNAVSGAEKFDDALQTKREALTVIPTPPLSQVPGYAPDAAGLGGDGLPNPQEVRFPDIKKLAPMQPQPAHPADLPKLLPQNPHPAPWPAGVPHPASLPEPMGEMLDQMGAPSRVYDHTAAQANDTLYSEKITDNNTLYSKKREVQPPSTETSDAQYDEIAKNIGDDEPVDPTDPKKPWETEQPVA